MLTLLRNKSCNRLAGLGGKWRSRRGQALAEMAVLGSVILIIIGAMVSYGQLLNAQHDTQMYTFRRALHLTNKRFNDGAFGQVSLTVQREYPSANILDNQPGVQQSEASASILWDSMQNYYERDSVLEGKIPLDPNDNMWQDRSQERYYITPGDFSILKNASVTQEDLRNLQNDFGVNYQQMGEEMVRNNRYVEMPQMVVVRRPDEESPRNFIEAFLETLFSGGGGTPSNYVSIETAPYTGADSLSDIKQTSATHRAQTGSQISSQDQTIINSDSATVYPINEDYLNATERQELDENIEAVLFMPGNMTVTQKEDITRTRQWQTDTQK